MPGQQLNPLPSFTSPHPPHLSRHTEPISVFSTILLSSRSYLCCALCPDGPNSHWPFKPQVRSSFLSVTFPDLPRPSQVSAPVLSRHLGILPLSQPLRTTHLPACFSFQTVMSWTGERALIFASVMISTSSDAAQACN